MWTICSTNFTALQLFESISLKHRRGLTLADWCLCPIDFICCSVYSTGLVKGCGLIEVVSFHTLNLTSSGEHIGTRVSGYESIWWFYKLLAILGLAVWLNTRPRVVPETVSDVRAKELEAIVTGERAVLVCHLTTRAGDCPILRGSQYWDTGLGCNRFNPISLISI